jgi:hypothetical protein
VPLEEWFERYGGVTPIDGNLYRSPLPYTRAHFEALRQAGIRVVYSMEEAVPGPLALSRGFDWRPHFWTDDQPPKPEQMERFLADYLALPPDVPALVHCKAGWGRTGSAVACALMAKHGWTAETALRHYWSRVPPAREVMEWNGQAEFVRGWGARLAGRGLP